MKVLFCIPSLYSPGGMERILSEKVNHFVNLDSYNVFIVTTDQCDRKIWFELDNRINLIHLDLDFDGHFDEGLLKKFILHHRKLILYKSQLRDLINELDIDVCISLGGKEIDFLGKLNVSCKKVAELHFGMDFRKQFLASRKKGIFWCILGELHTLRLKNRTKQLDKLVVLTKADELNWRKSHSNVVQIYNNNPMTNEVVSKLDNKRVLSIGRLDTQKGFDLLLQSWALVVVKHPDWVLDIYGAGELEGKLSAQIISSKLEGKVNLCGPTADVTLEYLSSSIYVLSSRYEGFAMVLLEAMSFGLPVVSFDCDFGPAEIIIEGHNGFLVEPLNVKQLADTILVLIESPDTRLRMGKHARETVKKFSKVNIMRQWVSLLDDLKN